MSEIHTVGGYDCLELLWIAESAYGTPPTTGEWKQIGLPATFLPSLQPQRRDRTGLGVYQPTDFDTTKRFGIFSVNQVLLHDYEANGDPTWEWMDFLLQIIGAETAGIPTKAAHIPFYSIGARIDRPSADEYWLMFGAKHQQVTIHGEIEDALQGRLAGWAQYGSKSITDYVSGTATRQAAAAVAGNPILFSDCDIDYMPTGYTPGSESIIDKVQSFDLILSRVLERKGSDATTKIYYRELGEVSFDVAVNIVLDYIEETEIDDFIAETEFTMRFDIPETASHGIRMELTGGKWMTQEQELREVELISVPLTARFTNITVSRL